MNTTNPPKIVPLTLFTVVELCKEANIPIDLEQLVILVQAHTVGVNQPQAYIQSETNSRLGFFRLSPRIVSSEWDKVLSTVSNPIKQVKLVLHEERNKNGKLLCSVTTPSGHILGYLSGYSQETLDTFQLGNAQVINAEPCSDISDWLEF